MKILLHFSYIRFKTIEFKNSTHPFIKKNKNKKQHTTYYNFKSMVKKQHTTSLSLSLYIYIHSCEY